MVLCMFTRGYFMGMPKNTLSAVFEINMFNIVSVFQDENSADVLPTKKCNGFTAVHH